MMQLRVYTQNLTKNTHNTEIQYVRDKMGTHFDPNCKHFYQNSHFIEFPFYRIPILPRKNSNAFQLFSIPISRKTSVLVSKSLLFDKLFIKIFPFSWKLSNLPAEFPFYRIPILPRKNSSVFWRKCDPLSHFIEFPFYLQDMDDLSSSDDRSDSDWVVASYNIT